MNIENQKAEFESTINPIPSVLLTFEGIDGYDVYNCSAPFWHGEKEYIYGRVEYPQEWARSRTMLFEKKMEDIWSKVNNSMIYQLEDPNIARIHGQLVLGGVFVSYSGGKGQSYQNFFYKGTDLENLYFFTTGPNNMKDIRLVELPDKKIGVFSRPRGEAIRGEHLSDSLIGFTVIDDLYDLTAKTIESAPYIPDLFQADEWGGVNEAFYLESGNIGIIGHMSFHKEKGEAATSGFMAGTGKQVYVTVSMIFDPRSHCVIEKKIIATRSIFPAYRAKKPHIEDCTFPSGMIMRKDGMCDLYCGLSDCAEGRAVIEYPFSDYGNIVTF